MRSYKPLYQALLFSLFLLCRPLSASPHEYLAEYFKEATPVDVSELKGGLSGAKNYKVTVNKKVYVLRILNPRESADARRREIQAATFAGAHGIGPVVFFSDVQCSSMIMEFIDGRTLTSECLQDPQRLAVLLQTIKKLHTSTGDFPQGCTIFSRIRDQLTKLQTSTIPAPQMAVKAALAQLAQIEEQLNQEQLVFCHNDLSALNVIEKDNKFYIIDWTDCGVGQAYNDLGYFALVNSLGTEQRREILRLYLGKEPSQKNEELLALMYKVNMLRIFASNFPAYEPPQASIAVRKIREVALEKILASPTLPPLEHFFQLHREGKLEGQEMVIELSLSALRGFLED